MNALGAAALVSAFVVAVYAAVAALIGTGGDRRWVVSSRRAIYAMCGLLVLAVVALEVAFVRSDLSVALVAEHSSTTTPLLYKLTALWGSQAGSLLLWAFVLSIASSAVLLITRHRHREVVPWATAVLAGVAAFFLGLMIAGIFVPGAASWPFAAADPVPAEGRGLMPLLRHPAMAMHPPMLYSGYVFFTVPFAFAVGALVTRRLDASWIRTTRRFALIAWIFLSVGLALGAAWSYSELGWGGYWAWDPVENAALLPWLTGTAFLHSIMIQERRGMLRVWNVSLICATFALSLLGTFLVRSGVLQSIHAFGESKVGPPLLALIGVVIIGSTVLIVSRLDSLRSPRRLDSLFSRESVFLLNNLLLVAIAAVVAWGTFFPLISEAITGDSSSLASPWFNRYATPIAIVLVLFMGIGPLVAWRRVTPAGLRKALGFPTLVMLIVGIVLALTVGISESITAYLMFLAGAFTVASVGQEFWRGSVARRKLVGGSLPSAFASLMTRNRRRYGGYIVHVGLVLVLFGIAASSSFQTSRDVRLLPGESTEVGDYAITYTEPSSRIEADENKLVLGSVLEVRRDGELVTVLHPSREYFSSSVTDPDAPLRTFFEGEATSEVGRQTTFTRDLWSAMQPDLATFEDVIEEGDELYARFARGVPDTPEGQAQLAGLQGSLITALSERYVKRTPPADIRFNVNPFVLWIWTVVIVALLGALFAIWPVPEGRRRAVTDVYGARLARELGS